MKLALPLITILLVFNWYTVPVHESVAYKREAKLFYDRVPPETELFRQPRCSMPGRIWWRGACWLPGRIVENME